MSFSDDVPATGYEIKDMVRASEDPPVAAKELWFILFLFFIPAIEFLYLECVDDHETRNDLPDHPRAVRLRV